MLSWPVSHGGRAFLVVIDKAAHSERYYHPKNPYLLALQFVLERIEHYLETVGDHGYCVYDQNKRMEADIHSHTIDLIRDGSSISYFSAFYGTDVYRTMSLDRILELSLGNSKNSLGLQVADFFATSGYQYFKQGKPDRCGWWQTLKENLHAQETGSVEGWGLKVFPE